MLALRPATANDVPLLRTLIHEFAGFEKLPVSISEEMLLRDGFAANPRFHALMLEWEGEAAGYALYFDYYSSFEGRAIFLEDVYVREGFRRHGIGQAVIVYLARLAEEQDCFAVRWQVLDWNLQAIQFYKKLGAEFLNSWKTVTLEGKALHDLAGSTK